MNNVFHVSDEQLVSFNQARKDPAGDYWKMVMKDQPMPEAIKGLMIRAGTGDSHRFVKDFDIKPNVIIYHAHPDHKEKIPDASAKLVDPALKVWMKSTGSDR